MAKSTIEKKIESKVKSIQNQIKKLQIDLAHWQKIASDYETNRETIESILSVHNAPDLGSNKKGNSGRKN
jgi:hypothetical protein